MGLRGLGPALTVLIVMLGLVLPSGMSVRAQSAQPISVIATFSILGDIVSRVGGDRVSVSVLVPNGADAHVFEPTPEDAATLETAAVVFENGLGFEPWLDELYEASASQAARIVVTEGITPRGFSEEDADHEEEQRGPRRTRRVRSARLARCPERHHRGRGDPGSARHGRSGQCRRL